MRKSFQVLTNLLIGNLRIDLGCFYVRMSENTANGFNWYSCAII